MLEAPTAGACPQAHIPVEGTCWERLSPCWAGPCAACAEDTCRVLRAGGGEQGLTAAPPNTARKG